MSSSKFASKAGFLSTYSFAHFAVDASSAFLFFELVQFSKHIILNMLIYNALAFVLQAPLGLLIDKKLNPQLASIFGLLVVAVSFLFERNIYLALILVSIGNALFHVGGGSLVLSMRRNVATFSGLYVAPGGIGLALGTWLSVSGFYAGVVILPIVLVALSFLLIFIPIPAFERSSGKSNNPDYRILLIALLLIPVAVRSLIGLSIEFPWKENPFLLYTLVAALAFGKIFGGFLADKVGLIKVGVGGLLISVPLLAFFATSPALGILGGFVFNFSMPVTLVAIAKALPRHKGLAFGLTTVALFVGALPSIIGKNGWLKNDWVIFVFITAASVILGIALFATKKSKIITA